ncbi:MAG: hypothetical protein LC793_05140 [Thermomicrobia bacterium]|nr:hypothetical protein [Thermomicrobia bacterium]MCA1724695.1 hypothetical protein [Thermomicrobia bacterium]
MSIREAFRAFVYGKQNAAWVSEEDFSIPPDASGIIILCDANGPTMMRAKNRDGATVVRDLLIAARAQTFEVTQAMADHLGMVAAPEVIAPSMEE